MKRSMMVLKRNKTPKKWLIVRGAAFIGASLSVTNVHVEALFSFDRSLINASVSSAFDEFKNQRLALGVGR